MSAPNYLLSQAEQTAKMYDDFIEQQAEFASMADEAKKK